MVSETEAPRAIDRSGFQHGANRHSGRIERGAHGPAGLRDRALLKEGYPLSPNMPPLIDVSISMPSAGRMPCSSGAW
jgi:hypothetical protein